jgi:hypothetical protein
LRQFFVFGFLPRAASMCASSASSMYCDKLLPVLFRQTLKGLLDFGL